jgi:hypothetical protein
MSGILLILSPMQFLFPGFLFALAAVAIPVVIHLFNFRRFRKVYFSNVGFLRQIEQRTSSARKVRNLILLACRVLAIVFLVLAFARPFISGDDRGGAEARHLLSIYIDNSYSMETVNREGALLDEARRRAREIVSAYGVNDRFQLLTNDFEGKHQRLLSGEEFLRELEGVRISPANKDLSQILARQEEAFSGEPGVKRTAYLISDFQRNMMGSGAVKADTLTDVRLVKLRASSLPNVSVDSAWFVSPFQRLGSAAQLVVQLRNNSEKSAQNVPIKLFVNSVQKAIGNITVPARSTARDTLSYTSTSGGWQRGRISITDYPIIFDDEFFFSYELKTQVPVLAINEGNASRYIPALYSADPYFKLSQMSAGNIDYAALPSYQLIILNGVSSISTGLAAQLAAYVRNGGSLMVFPDLKAEGSGLNLLTGQLGTDRPAAVVNQKTRANFIDLKNSLFAGVFEQTPRNLDLPQVSSYLKYTNASRTTRQVILGLPGNGSLLSQYQLGAGKVFLFAVPADEENSNLVRHSVFVPLMFQAAFTSVRGSRLSYTIGRDQVLEAGRLTLGANQTVTLNRKGFSAIPDLRRTETGTKLFIADQVREAGTYNLEKGDSLVAAYSFNTNRNESDLSYTSEQELKRAFPGTRVKLFQPGGESVQEAIKAVNKGVQLWKLCLILGLISLAAEILIIRFYRPARQKSLSHT